jgi:GTPase Era involved in 16S rRNA processing
MFKEKFTEKELKQARDNGFILTGKTGRGKSTLLNIIFNKYIAEAKICSYAVTTKTQVYYLKLKNGRCVALVDTPGLSDPKKVCENKKDLDIIHLKDIEKTISEEKVHIKGILFLVNYQDERFDSSEQEALLSYNKLFPLKKFWEHLVIIYTHYYYDPNEDYPEEIRRSKEETNSKLFSDLMQNIKNISDVIDYRALKIKYYNSYSPVRNEKQRIQNSKNKEDIERLLNDFCEKEPLFCFIEFMQIKNERIVEDGITYSVEYQVIGFFDLNHRPIKEKTTIISKKIINDYIPPISIDYYRTNINKDIKHEVKPIPEEESKLRKYKSQIGFGGGGLAGFAIAALASAGTAATLGAGLLGAGIGYGISKLFDDEKENS